MTDTYCGKNCTDCSQKEALSCPGCKAGPGKRYGANCQLAKCCIAKGHQDCSTCGFHEHCSTLQRKDSMPSSRLAAIEAETERKAALAKRAPILGKWLWILFWLVIPSTIASVLGNDTVIEWVPALFVPSLVLSAICSFTYGGILVKLGSEEAQYRTAGICSLISGSVSLLIACVSGGAEAPNWTLLFSLPAAIIALVGEYNEFSAHSKVLSDLDDTLSADWNSLWKWFIGTYGAMMGSILIILIAPILGLLVLIAAAIGLIVVSIIKLVYLYKTAKLFREYKIEDAY